MLWAPVKVWRSNKHHSNKEELQKQLAFVYSARIWFCGHKLLYARLILRRNNSRATFSPLLDFAEFAASLWRQFGQQTYLKLLVGLPEIAGLLCAGKSSPNANCRRGEQQLPRQFNFSSIHSFTRFATCVRFKFNYAAAAHNCKNSTCVEKSCVAFRQANFRNRCNAAMHCSQDKVFLLRSSRKTQQQVCRGKQTEARKMFSFSVFFHQQQRKLSKPFFAFFFAICTFALQRGKFFSQRRALWMDARISIKPQASSDTSLEEAKPGRQQICATRVCPELSKKLEANLFNSFASL